MTTVTWRSGEVESQSPVSPRHRHQSASARECEIRSRHVGATKAHVRREWVSGEDLLHDLTTRCDDGDACGLQPERGHAHVARTIDGEIHHVEFQTTNEPGFGLRMLGYYYYLISTHKKHVVQTVLYMGRDPLRLESTFTTPSLELRYEIINLSEYDAESLLASDDWADIVMALLAKGDPSKVLTVATERLRKMGRDDQAWASGTLLLLSGILGIEATVNARLKEADVINVMENKVLGPMILQEYEKGRGEGRQARDHREAARHVTEGRGRDGRRREEGRREVLRLFRVPLQQPVSGDQGGH